MVSHRSKQNGHPVPLKGIVIFDQEKTYPKEACDVRTHHSTLFPVSSNQNCRPDRFGRPLRSPDTDTARQALSTDLPLLWTKGHWGSQLDRAQGPGSEPGRHTGLDQNSLSQSVLCALSSCQCRRSRAVSPVSAGDHPVGPLCLPVVPADDRHRSGAPCGPGLEDGKGHRHILSGTRLRSARARWAAPIGCRRDLHPQGPPLPDRGPRLCQRARAVCRKAPQGQNLETVFQSTQAPAT